MAKSKGLPSSLDADMVRAHVRNSMEMSNISLRSYAKIMEISPSHLSRFLAGEREPGPKVLDAFGLKAVTYYEWK